MQVKLFLINLSIFIDHRIEFNRRFSLFLHLLRLELCRNFVIVWMAQRVVSVQSRKDITYQDRSYVLFMSFRNLAFLLYKLAITYVRIIGFLQCSILIFEVSKAVKPKDVLTNFTDVKPLQNCLCLILCNVGTISGSYKLPHSDVYLMPNNRKNFRYDFQVEFLR
jgi:hypothetical protein